MNRTLVKFALAAVALPALMSAGTLTLNGPMFPVTPPNAPGTPCVPGTTQGGLNCIDGIPANFNIFSVSLTNPTTAGGKWKIDILTNYPGVITNSTTPTSVVSIPTASYEGFQYGMADFMIQQGTTAYAVVLSSHDGLQAGRLYQSGVAASATGAAVANGGFGASGLGQQNGFLSTQYVLKTGNPNVQSVPRPTLPTLLNPTGATDLSGQAGSILVQRLTTNGQPGGTLTDGVSQALYKISVEFAAPVAFLSTGTFKIYASSYVCDNGWIVGAGDSTIFPPGSSTVIPEPSTWVMLVSGVAAFGLRRFRKN